MQKSHRRRAANLRPSADWDWVWDWDWVTLGSRLDHAWDTQASRLGHPSVTPGTPKRHAWDTQGSIGGRAFVCNESGKRPGGGGNRSPKLPKSGNCQLKNQIGRSHRNRNQNFERIRLYVVGKSCGSTRVSPMALMKFTSPNQRGRMCMWMWPVTPAPAALPRFIPRLMPSGR
jgi:hypothetical protein